MIHIVCNFTPVVRENYLIGLPKSGYLQEVLNSDDALYGGGNIKNTKKIKITSKPWDFKSNSAEITIPPLAITVFKIIS